MAENTQINPKIRPVTKVRLLEFCKDRGHSQGEVVDAALEAYFAPTEGDAQTIILQKLANMEHAMQEVITLLGSVIAHLEKQAKPPPPKIATRAELYPDLGIVETGEAEPSVVEGTPVPPRAPIWTLFGRRMR